jgi:thioredoxin reductase (NADPH)
MDFNYNVIIIGAGPIGLTCGIEAAKRQLSHLIIEKGPLVNSIYYYPTNMTFFSTSDRLEIGEVPFVSHGDKPTRREALEYFRRVKQAWNLNVKTYETAEEINKLNGGFEVITSRGRYTSKYVIIATGFYDKPNLLNIPGESLPKVKHYFDEAHPYAYQKVIVIGGGNSGVDVALETYRRGSEVTMVIREAGLKEGVKYWVKPDIENRIKEESIKAYFNSFLTEIREDSADIQTPEGKITIENDFVLAMTGYHPDYSLLEKAGIEISKDPMKIPCFHPQSFETNVPGLSLAGVVCGGMETGKWFIENSRDHAQRIFEKIEKI